MVLNQPKVSICIPTRIVTYQMFLSIKNLAFDVNRLPPFEVLIVFDGKKPTDWANAVLEGFGLDIVQIQMPKAGPAAARNLAASKARGEVLIFCDSDVVLTPDAVINSFAVEARELVVPVILPTVMSSHVARFFSEFVFAPRFGVERDYAVSAFWTMRKEDFDEIGHFDERFAHPAGEDMEFMKRWSASGRSLRYLESSHVFHLNPTTIRGLVSRAIRYGRHGNLPSKRKNSSRIQPTYLDIVVFPIAIALAAARRFISRIARGNRSAWQTRVLDYIRQLEYRVSTFSISKRAWAKKRNYWWLFIPKPISFLVYFVIQGLQFLMYMRSRKYIKKRSHKNKFLALIWLLAWNYGAFQYQLSEKNES